MRSARHDISCSWSNAVIWYFNTIVDVRYSSLWVKTWHCKGSFSLFGKKESGYTLPLVLVKDMAKQKKTEVIMLFSIKFFTFYYCFIIILFFLFMFLCSNCGVYIYVFVDYIIEGKKIPIDNDMFDSEHPRIRIGTLLYH